MAFFAVLKPFLSALMAPVVPTLEGTADDAALLDVAVEADVDADFDPALGGAASVVLAVAADVAVVADDVAVAVADASVGSFVESVEEVDVSVDVELSSSSMLMRGPMT